MTGLGMQLSSGKTIGLVPIVIKLRREWNIRNSLLEAYATLFLLSYVKILSVSVDLLDPIWLYNQQLCLYKYGWLRIV